MRYQLFYLLGYALWLLCSGYILFQALYLPLPLPGPSAAALITRTVVSLGILFVGPAVALGLARVRLGWRGWWLLSIPVAFVVGTLYVYLVTQSERVIIVPNGLFTLYLALLFLFSALRTSGLPHLFAPGGKAAQQSPEPSDEEAAEEEAASLPPDSQPTRGDLPNTFADPGNSPEAPIGAGNSPGTDARTEAGGPPEPDAHTVAGDQPETGTSPEAGGPPEPDARAEAGDPAGSAPGDAYREEEGRSGEEGEAADEEPDTRHPPFAASGRLLWFSVGAYVALLGINILEASAPGTISSPMLDIGVATAYGFGLSLLSAVLFLRTRP